MGKTRNLSENLMGKDTFGDTGSSGVHVR